MRSRDEFRLLLVLVAVVTALIVAEGAINAISEDQAVERFQELTETDDVVIVHHSNNMLLIGNTHDVTFELLVDGKPQSGRCTSGVFSAMVCRVYAPGTGD